MLPGQTQSRGRNALPGGSGQEKDNITFILKISESSSSAVISRDLVIVGDPAGPHIRVIAGSDGGIEIRDGEILRGRWDTDGNISIGSDLDDPGLSFFKVFSQGQVYNDEEMEEGDILVWNNSAGQANMLLEAATGRILFRGGQNAQAYIGTDGTVTAGSETVFVDSDGIRVLNTGASGPVSQQNGYVFTNDVGEVVAGTYGRTAGGINSVNLVAGWNVQNQSSTVEIGAAANDSGQPRLAMWLDYSNTGDSRAGEAGILTSIVPADLAGDKSPTMLFDIFGANSSGAFIPGFIKFLAAIQVPTMTTTDRDKIDPATGGITGAIIHNRDTGKFQGFDGTSWVDFH